MKEEILALIPARGGSKRIPRKNIRPFCGKPIIGYPIEAALKSGIFSEVMVSTDDIEIATFAKRAGAEVPFLRNERTSNDTALINEVIEEVLCEYQKSGRNFEYLCCIFATCPLITSKILKESFELLRNRQFDSVIPVIKYTHPIQRAFKITAGRLFMFSPENFAKRTQDLEPSYYDSGSFYWMKVESFMKNKKCLTENTGAFVIPEYSAVDIDTEEDWKRAEAVSDFLSRSKM